VGPDTRTDEQKATDFAEYQAKRQVWLAKLKEQKAEHVEKYLAYIKHFYDALSKIDFIRGGNNDREAFGWLIMIEEEYRALLGYPAFGDDDDPLPFQINASTNARGSGNGKLRQYHNTLMQVHRDFLAKSSNHEHEKPGTVVVVHEENAYVGYGDCSSGFTEAYLINLDQIDLASDEYIVATKLNRIIHKAEVDRILEEHYESRQRSDQPSEGDDATHCNVMPKRLLTI